MVKKKRKIKVPNDKKIEKKISKKTEEKEKKPKGLLKKIFDFYFHEYKKLFLLPISLFVIALLIIGMTYVQKGDFIIRDVTLKGGISLTINSDYSNINNLEKSLDEKFPLASVNIRTIESGGSVSGIIIEASDISEENLISGTKEVFEFDDYSVETMGSSLGESFFKQMFFALLLAFLFMGGVFHFYFRNIYATAAALISAFFDIVITVSIMNLIGLRLTAGGIAAYLMLIGYSIDTSILLSTKILKGTEKLKSEITDAMKTGLTMSAAGLAATLVSFFLTNNTTLKQIMLILIVGLFMDLITTWGSNVAFLRFYLEKKQNGNN